MERCAVVVWNASDVGWWCGVEQGGFVMWSVVKYSLSKDTLTFMQQSSIQVTLLQKIAHTTATCKISEHNQIGVIAAMVIVANT